MECSPFSMATRQLLEEHPTWVIAHNVRIFYFARNSRILYFQEKVEICFGSCPLAKSKLSPKFVMVLLLTFNLLMCASAQANVYHWHMGRLMWHWLFGLFQISYIVTLWIMNCTFIKKYAEMCADELKVNETKRMVSL